MKALILSEAKYTYRHHGQNHLSGQFTFYTSALTKIESEFEDMYYGEQSNYKRYIYPEYGRAGLLSFMLNLEYNRERKSTKKARWY